MSDIAKRLSAAMKSAANIGTQNGSAPPQVADNRFGLVYEYLIASRLKSYATARDENAKNALREAGIIDEDYKPGDYIPYSNELLAVTVKRNNDSTTLDSTKLKNELSKVLGADEADRLIKSCSKPRKGNTTIGVGMVS